MISSTTQGGCDVAALAPSALYLNPLPPVAGQDVQISGTNVQFSITGEVGLTYVVEASTDLLEWKPIWSQLNTGGTLLFVDTEAWRSDKRFYRVKESGTP